MQSRYPATTREENQMEVYSEEEIQLLEGSDDVEQGMFLAITQNEREAFLQAVKERYRPRILHPLAEKYLLDTVSIKNLDGPMEFNGVGAACLQLYSYDDMWKVGPKDRFIPGVPIAYVWGINYGRRYYKLVLSFETGGVISLPFEEYPDRGREIAERIGYPDNASIEQFWSSLEDAYSLFKVDQLLSFQASLSEFENSEGYDSLDKVEPEQLIRAAAAAFDRSFSELKELAGHPSFSFLPMDEGVLARLAEEEK